MQSRRINRRRKILLAVLLFLSLATWLYAKRDRVFEEFKRSAEKTLSRQLQLEIKIGRFDTGLFRKISFRDLSISDQAKNFRIVARRTYFDFSVWDILLKKYGALEYISLRVDGVDFFRKDFRFPLRVSYAEASLKDGILEVHNLRGYLNGNIPFELEGTLALQAGNSPRIAASCRFLSVSPDRRVPAFLPAVISLNGDLHRLFLKGSGEDPGAPAFNIEGDIKLKDQWFSFVLLPPTVSPGWTEEYLAENAGGMSSARIFERSPRIVLSGNFSQSNRFNIRLGLEHVRFSTNELLCNILLEGEFIPRQNILEGKVYSSGSLLNYLPLPEFEGFYRLRGESLEISHLKWTDSLILSGNLDFTDAVSGRLLISINNFNLAHFASIYYPQWNAWGSVDGKVNLDISKGEFITQGDITFSEGLLGPFKFKGGRVQFDGRNGILRIKESRVYQEGGYLDITGEVNLKRLGKPDFGKKLVLASNQDNIKWQGWSISRKDDSGTIAVDKGIDDKFSIAFRSYMRNSVGMTDERRDEFDLEYKLRDDKSLKIRLKENEELLGVEHKVRF